MAMDVLVVAVQMAELAVPWVTAAAMAEGQVAGDEAATMEAGVVEALWAAPAAMEA